MFGLCNFVWSVILFVEEKERKEYRTELNRIERRGTQENKRREEKE
jgi:hypothetical protein